MIPCFERAFTTVELIISMMIVGVMVAFLTHPLRERCRDITRIQQGRDPIFVWWKQWK